MFLCTFNRFGLDGESAFTTDAPLITRERHRAHLSNATEFIEAFLATRE